MSKSTDWKQANYAIWSRRRAQDTYGKNNVFKARALTQGFVLTPAMAKGLESTRAGKEGDDKDTRHVRMYFIGRILGPNSPHKFLPDPCDPIFTDAETTACALNAISLHTIFITTKDFNYGDKDAISPNDIFNVALKAGTGNAPYNLQVGMALNRNKKFQARNNKDDTENCKKLSSMDFAGASDCGMPTPEPETRTIAGQSVTNGNLPSDMRAEVDTNNSSAGTVLAAAVSDFNKMAAAFKAVSGSMFPLNQGYRSYAGQVKAACMYASEPGRAATPGTSNHGWGLAFDMNIPGAGNTTAQFEHAYYIWMAGNAGNYGWVNPSWARQDCNSAVQKCKAEPWHWEYTKSTDPPVDDSGEPLPTTDADE